MKVPRSRRRGKSRIFRMNTFRASARVGLIRSNSPMNARVINIVHDSYRTAPLMEIKFEDGQTSFLPAFVGAYTGMLLSYLKPENSSSDGMILRLRDMPAGTDVYNIELRPNDGGKLVRAGGGSAKIMEITHNKVSLALPSGKVINVDPECKAIIGKISNGGRKEKPLYKAGNSYHLIRARGRYWPMNAAVAMNAYEHKFGGKRRSSQHRTKSVSRRAPPGAKVGSISPKRTGVR